MLTRVRHERRERVRTSEDAEAQSSQTRAVKGERRCHHEVQQDAQSPDVHQRSDVTLVPKEFRGGVRRRAAEGGEDVGGLAFSTEAKVTHFDAVCGGVEDIFSLQVPVDDVVVMLKQTVSERRPVYSPDQTGALWWRSWRIALLQARTPSPGEACETSPPPHTDARCWGGTVSPCSVSQKRTASASACPDAAYPGSLQLLFLREMSEREQGE